VSSNLTFYSFVGPAGTVTTTDGQQIAGAASAVVNFSSQLANTAAYALCYQDATNGGLLQNLAQFNIFAEFPPVSEATLTVAAAGTVPAGTWHVGLCVAANGDIVSGTMSGWAQVTN
jgi:hypothetical protein